MTIIRTDKLTCGNCKVTRIGSADLSMNGTDLVAVVSYACCGNDAYTVILPGRTKISK